MAEEKNIVMRQYNGTDYDTLYPATKSSQIATTTEISSKFFADPAGKTTEDILNWLGNYNLYWWKRRTVTPNTEYQAKQGSFNVQNPLTELGAGVGAVTVVYSNSPTLKQEGNGYVFLNEILSYEDNINTPDPSSGYSGGITLFLGGSSITGGKTLSNPYYMYIKKGNKNSNIYMIQGTSQACQVRAYSSTNLNLYIQGSNVGSISATTTIESITAGYNYGEWEYLTSNNINQYPKNGITENYEYQFLGIPFNNATEAQKSFFVKYYGTGQNTTVDKTFNLDFIPKFIGMTVYDTQQSTVKDMTTCLSSPFYPEITGTTNFRLLGLIHDNTYSQNTTFIPIEYNENGEFIIKQLSNKAGLCYWFYFLG